MTRVQDVAPLEVVPAQRRCSASKRRRAGPLGQQRLAPHPLRPSKSGGGSQRVHPPRDPGTAMTSLTTPRLNLVYFSTRETKRPVPGHRQSGARERTPPTTGTTRKRTESKIPGTSPPHRRGARAGFYWGGPPCSATAWQMRRATKMPRAVADPSRDPSPLRGDARCEIQSFSVSVVNTNAVSPSPLSCSCLVPLLLSGLPSNPGPLPLPYPDDPSLASYS